MRLYENALDNFSEIKTYYPVWYWDVLEMAAIWKISGKQLDDLRAGIIQAVNNNFVSTADPEALTALEEFLYIDYDGPRTTSERRALIASFFLGNGHIGEKELRELVASFTSGEIAVDLVGGTIEISVTRELSDRFNLSDCLFIVGKRIPAHLALVFNDILLPIRFVTHERLSAHNLHLQARFFNGGSSTAITLNGQKTLDGTWTLDQLFKGILFEAFAVAADIREHNELTAQKLVCSPMSIANSNDAELSRLSFGTTAKNRSGFVQRETSVVGAHVTQTYKLTGRLKQDSLYPLDGSVLLDGSRKLNAKIEEEDI